MKSKMQITHKHYCKSERFPNCIDVSLGWQCTNNIDMDSFIEVQMFNLGSQFYEFNKSIIRDSKMLTFQYKLLFIVKEDTSGLSNLTIDNLINSLINKIETTVETAISKIGTTHHEYMGLLDDKNKKQISHSPKQITNQKKRFPG
jgi:hypothetical protein